MMMMMMMMMMIIIIIIIKHIQQIQQLLIVTTFVTSPSRNSRITQIQRRAHKNTATEIDLCTTTTIHMGMFFFVRQPSVGQSLLILEVSRSHTTTHHIRQDSSKRVISSSQRPLPDNTQHSQQTNIHDPGGIRTYSLSRREAADLRLRPRGYWDRPTRVLFHTNYTKV